MTASALNDAIVLDKLRAVRKTVAISIPVNVILGIAALAVATHAGKGTMGALWFSFSLAINMSRLLFCRFPIIGDGDETGGRESRHALTVRRHLGLHCLFAFLSGFAWALIPILCDGYTAPETLFYLTVVCGITAGAVTHGFAYAIIPIVFITPPLVSVIGCLVYAGDYDRYWLAATVFLYLLALIRGSRVGEELVDSQSRLKNEATLLSRSLETANRRITLFARDMRERAIHDDLTGLLNRRGFAEVIISQGAASQEAGRPARALEADTRHEGRMQRQSLMLFDLDGFKTINDAFGHKTGDMILIEVARRLQASLPADTPLARLGGDEFAALVDLKAGEAGPEMIASKLIGAVAAPFARLPAGRIGVSIGICERDDNDLDNLLVAADVALYAAKNAGRNRFHVFDEDLRCRAQMTRDIERDLAAAMAERAVTMWYQPIMAENGTRVNTLEALVRWRHPAHGIIPPMELIAVSALAGLSGDLLRYILREITDMVVLLREKGLDDIRIAMNVSPREMTQMPVDEIVITEFQALDLPLDMLEIEITEEIAIDPPTVKAKLDRLTQAGVRIAIDDFGSGYSSLSALQSLQIDRVKIDRALVQGLAGSPERRALVDAVLHVSRSFGFDVVGEGVETPEDQAELERLGCKLMQGYALSKPLPRDDILAWIELKRHAG